jgi:hypothetical protein
MKSPSQKSPSQAQSTAATLSNSMLQSVSNNMDSPAFPTLMTNTSPESQAKKNRQRLRMILDSAIALIDDKDDDEGFNPIELCTMIQRPLQ